MQFILIFHYLADKTEAQPRNKLMPSVYTITDSSCTGTNQLERIGPLLLTHENGDFGAVSVTELSCAAPILKVVVTYRMGFCATPVVDPDLQISGGGGRGRAVIQTLRR